MRKSLVLLLLAASVMPAFAQVDTLRWRQREPTFYYWGNHWADCNVYSSTQTVNEYCPSIIARYCYTDTHLNVLGIAAASFTKRDSLWGTPLPFVDTSLAHRVAEYFQLYEATDSSFDLLAEARWDTTHPRYRMSFPNLWSVDGSRGYIERFPFIYEAYFDKPYLVRDSFYVAMTTNNNGIYYDEAAQDYTYNEHPHTEYYLVNVMDSDDCAQFKRKVTNPYSLAPQTQVSAVINCRALYQQGWRYYASGHAFVVIFPIFDTTGLEIHGFRWIGGCDTIRTFHLLYIDSGRAYLSWNAGPKARWWDVSYGPSGTTPERGTKIQQHTSMVCLDSLQGGRRYVVYVREHCRDDTRGPWSDSVSFYMPASSGIQQPEASIVECSTHLIPNPASGPVTVISGFRIEAIEVYTVAGTLVETIGLKANTGVINTSRWPKGAYILRIRTSHGDTAKRLVVQ